MRNLKYTPSSDGVRVMCCSPRESEWDADVSHGSRDSPLNAAVIKVDWAGGPSYGLGSRATPGRPPTVRHYSLLSPITAGRGSVVTFDIGEPGVRRHSSPVMSNGGRRRSIVAADSSRLPSIGGSTTTALRSPFGPRRSADDFRPLQAHFRKRSSAEQSLTSFRIGSNDDDLVEEEEEEADFEEQAIDEDDELKADSGDGGMVAGGPPPPLAGADEAEDGASSATAASEILPAITATAAVAVSGSETEKKRGGGVALRRNHTDDSEVERRVAKLLYDINFSGTDSVDESKIQSRCSVGETTTTTSNSTSTTNGVLRAEMETQTMTEQELAAMHLQSVCSAVITNKLLLILIS